MSCGQNCLSNQKQKPYLYRLSVMTNCFWKGRLFVSGLSGNFKWFFLELDLISKRKQKSHSSASSNISLSEANNDVAAVFTQLNSMSDIKELYFLFFPISCVVLVKQLQPRHVCSSCWSVSLQKIPLNTLEKNNSWSTVMGSCFLCFSELHGRRGTHYFGVRNTIIGTI